MSETTDEFQNQKMFSVLEDALERAIYAKTEMCKDEPMSDNPPMLLVGYNKENVEEKTRLTIGDDDDSELQIGMVPLIHKDDVRECLVDAIGAIPTQKFEFLILAVEGYKDEMSEDLPEGWSRGDLAKDFKENPFTTVREGVIVSGVDWEHKYAINGACTYSYDDKGVPQFGEPMWSQVEISEETGMMTFIMASACEFMKKKIITESFHALLEATPKKSKKDKE
jgi:hypothetical protein